MSKKPVNIGGIGPITPEPGRIVMTESPERTPPDLWNKESTHTFACVTCMHYLNYRCRRHAPKVQEGWPAVYPNDYCGDHKMDKRTMADRA